MKVRILAMMMVAASVASCQQLPQSATAGTQAGQARQAPADPAEFDRNMAQVQENMRKMDEQMARIRQTSDPQERQRLLDEHWRTMQESMAMMHNAWGPGMMGCCGHGPMMHGGPAGPHMRGGPMMGGGMGWRNMHEYYSSLTPEQLKQRQYMTEQHMAMQQMMMNHMMQHHQWMMRPPQR